jgi:hypothetical protein
MMSAAVFGQADTTCSVGSPRCSGVNQGADAAYLTEHGTIYHYAGSVYNEVPIATNTNSPVSVDIDGASGYYVVAWSATDVSDPNNPVSRVYISLNAGSTTLVGQQYNGGGSDVSAGNTMCRVAIRPDAGMVYVAFCGVGASAVWVQAFTVNATAGTLATATAATQVNATASGGGIVYRIGDIASDNTTPPGCSISYVRESNGGYTGSAGACVRRFTYDIIHNQLQPAYQEQSLETGSGHYMWTEMGGFDDGGCAVCVTTGTSGGNMDLYRLNGTGTIVESFSTINTTPSLTLDVLNQTGFTVATHFDTGGSVNYKYLAAWNAPEVMSSGCGISGTNFAINIFYRIVNNGTLGGFKAQTAYTDPGQEGSAPQVWQPAVGDVTSGSPFYYHYQFQGNQSDTGGTFTVDTLTSQFGC